MSEFWVRKIKTHFRRFDCNGDGFLTKEDFELLGERLGEQNEDPARRKSMVETCIEFFSYFEKYGSGDGKVTEEQWIDAMRKLREDPEFATYLKTGCSVTFDLLDFDGDGFIQEEEYARFFHGIGIHDHENLAKIAFKGIDSNQDGKLCREEFGIAVYDFLCSEDKTRPGTLAYGPLV